MTWCIKRLSTQLAKESIWIGCNKRQGRGFDTLIYLGEERRFLFAWYNKNPPSPVHNTFTLCRGYLAERKALSATRKHGGLGPFGRIPSFSGIAWIVFYRPLTTKQWIEAAIHLILYICLWLQQPSNMPTAWNEIRQILVRIDEKERTSSIPWQWKHSIFFLFV